MINTISIIATGISILGLSLLLILAGRIYTINKENQLKKHRRKDEGLADLLNYASVIDDGIILCKNGAFMAAWMFLGEDYDTILDQRKEYISLRLNQCIAALGNGWMLHVDAVRLAAPSYSEAALSFFPDKVTAAIDEERRGFFERNGNVFETAHVLTATFFPPMLARAKFTELLFDDQGQKVNPKSRSLAILAEFKKKIANLESGLSSVLRLFRLKSHTEVTENGDKVTYDAFLRYIQFCLTGLEHPVILPKNPSYIDGFIGGQELWGGTIPKIGKKFVQVVAIEGFPLESYPGMLSAIADIPVSCRFSSRFIFTDQHQAEAALQKQKKKWQQKQRGIVDQVFNRPISPDRINQDAVAMVADANNALQEINEGIVAFGYYTPVIVLMDESRPRVEESSRNLAKLVNNLGFVARVETINTLDAFFGSLPGHGVENVRRPFINTLNFADLLPTSGIWTGQDEAPCPFYPPKSPPLMHCVTKGASPYRFNTHVRDVGHALVVGATGAGKSTLLSEMAAQASRYKGATITAFDVGASMYPLVRASGGNFYDIGGENAALSFAPLQHIGTEQDRAWALEWIEKILGLNNVEPSPTLLKEISAALLSLARVNSGNICLTDFIGQVQSNTVREVLQQYDSGGPLGDMLSSDKDGLVLSRFNVFEIEHLMQLGEKWSLPVLDYLFRRVERANRGQPSWLFLDEAWLMLGHKAFSAKIRAWLKVFRKANCAVVMATQNLMDFSNSSIFTDIVDSTASKIFLPNIYAKNEDVAAVYRRMGLNEQQINIIAGAVAKRHYYHVSELGSRLFDLALGPVALSFVGSSDKDSLARIRRLESQYGDKWPGVWVRERTGLNLDEYTANFSG
jgi:type IV secretion system protein VirB4